MLWGAEDGFMWAEDGFILHRFKFTYVAFESVEKRFIHFVGECGVDLLLPYYYSLWWLRVDLIELILIWF